MQLFALNNIIPLTGSVSFYLHIDKAREASVEIDYRRLFLQLVKNFTGFVKLGTALEF